MLPLLSFSSVVICIRFRRFCSNVQTCEKGYHLTLIGRPAWDRQRPLIILRKLLSLIKGRQYSNLRPRTLSLDTENFPKYFLFSLSYKKRQRLESWLLPIPYRI